MSNEQKLERIKSLLVGDKTFDSDEARNEYIQQELAKQLPTQNSLTQERISNIDEIFQKQLIWSFNEPSAEDAYFYWDWCPLGDGTPEQPKWQIAQWYEYPENQKRTVDRTFKWSEIKGYTNRGWKDGDLMPTEYDARMDDNHARDPDEEYTEVDLTKETLRHNIMRSYLEVSEWLGDGATQYGSHNGYVSRKMSLSWLFCAIRALINWKMNNQDKWKEKDIYPLDIDEHNEHFLDKDETSDCGLSYDDVDSLDQQGGCCQTQTRQRAGNPNKNGTLKVRGNEWHYGERAYFWTHTSFVGECRFFHNARFFGQTTFDKEINGTAMRSRWADLAEFKEADKEYEPGTLVMFGGEKEITLSRNGVANAIVTTKPGLILNGDEPSKNCIMVGIALTGTVPVRIVDKVKKFDRLVASKKYPGYARAKKWWEFWKKPIAIALESFPAGGVVNCMTKMEF